VILPSNLLRRLFQFSPKRENRNQELSSDELHAVVSDSSQRIPLKRQRNQSSFELGTRYRWGQNAKRATDR